MANGNSFRARCDSVRVCDLYWDDVLAFLYWEEPVWHQLRTPLICRQLLKSRNRRRFAPSFLARVWSRNAHAKHWLAGGRGAAAAAKKEESGSALWCSTSTTMLCHTSGWGGQEGHFYSTYNLCLVHFCCFTYPNIIFPLHVCYNSIRNSLWWSWHCLCHLSNCHFRNHFSKLSINFYI